MVYGNLMASILALAATCAEAKGPVRVKRPAAKAPAAVVAVAALADGSTIRGELRTPRISGSTAFAKELSLDPAMVASLAFGGKKGCAKVELSNGDRFSMKIATGSFTLKSSIGMLEIPRDRLRSIEFSARRGADAAGGLVFHCTFDGENALAAPECGPAVKLECGSVVRGKGRSGGALFVPPGVAGAQVTFPAGTLGPEGRIEFWARLAGGKPEFESGGDPRFFVLSRPDGKEISHLEFASNDGCGDSGLSVHFCGQRTQTGKGFRNTMPYSAVFNGGDIGGWHRYEFAWSPARISIRLDGKEVCHADGPVDTGRLAGGVVMDIPLSRTRGRSHNNKAAFYMDDLKVWNTAKRRSGE